MYKVKVNGKYTFEFSDDLTSVDNRTLELNMPSEQGTRHHIISGNKSYQAELVSFDKEAKLALVKVNGQIYEVQIEDDLDDLLKAMGLNTLVSRSETLVKAPMPGLVLQVHVSVGQKVSKGDNLIVLEAMKMENMLKSALDGTIVKILVAEGEKVEKNQVLIYFA